MAPASRGSLRTWRRFIILTACCGYDAIASPFLALVAVVWMAVATPAGAHHWFNASYDFDRMFTMTGVVTRFEWRNPHVLVYMDVGDEQSGPTTNWLMEMGSPSGLVRGGWSKSTLKVGDWVVVQGHPLRDGTPMGYPRVITIAATGRRLEPAAPLR